jgi:hypothetical protein
MTTGQCPSLFVEHNYPLSWLYYIQLTIGLSGSVCPALLYALFQPQELCRDRGTSESKVPVGRCSSDSASALSPLRLLQVSALLLLLALAMLTRTNTARLNLWMLVWLALYGLSSSLCAALLRLFVMSKVRARSVCLLWAWFEFAQALPILIGPTISGEPRHKQTQKRDSNLDLFVFAQPF